MKKMLFVMNPVAGQKKANKALPEILLMFNQAGYEVIISMTSGPGSAAKAVETWGGQVDLVVCCGGDGTMNETVTGLLRSGCKTPVGYIPAGTTNDFAEHLHILEDDLLPAQILAIKRPLQQRYPNAEIRYDCRENDVLWFVCQMEDAATMVGVKTAGLGLHSRNPGVL